VVRSGRSAHRGSGERADRKRAERDGEDQDDGEAQPGFCRGVRHDPEYESLLADSVGLALLVVLDSLAPAERLAFVLHDMFAVPFAEIASIVGTTPAVARQLASRARRRVRGAAPAEDADLRQQPCVARQAATGCAGVRP
jgi:DNA-directed RNA polymerase specialized sigma24 family protein